MANNNPFQITALDLLKSSKTANDISKTYRSVLGLTGSMTDWYDEYKGLVVSTNEARNTALAIGGLSSIMPQWWNPSQNNVFQVATGANMASWYASQSIVPKNQLLMKDFLTYDPKADTRIGAFTAINGLHTKDLLSTVISTNNAITGSLDLIRSNFPVLDSSLLTWQTALTGVGKQIGIDAIRYKDDKVFKEFEGVSAIATKAATVIRDAGTSKLSKAETVSFQEQLESIKAELQQITTLVKTSTEATETNTRVTEINTAATEINTAVTQKNTRVTHVNTYASILSILLTVLMAIFPILQPGEGKSEGSARHEQLIQLKKEALAAAFEYVGVNMPHSYIQRSCPLSVKPKSRSLRIRTLNPNLAVSIIERRHQWVRVTFIDQEGDPIIGWVQSKYVMSPSVTGLLPFP